VQTLKALHFNETSLLKHKEMLHCFFMEISTYMPIFKLNTFQASTAGLNLGEN